MCYMEGFILSRMHSVLQIITIETKYAPLLHLPMRLIFAVPSSLALKAYWQLMEIRVLHCQ